LRSNPSDHDTFDGLRYRERIERARARLGRIASAFEFYPTVTSTNDVALERIASANGNHRDLEGLVVVADEQTEGRGRRGHAWFSPPGSGLYVSVVLAPARARVDPARATLLLTLAAGVAIAEGVDVATGLRVDLKWPNDLQVSRRKLAGILAEGAAANLVVLGYGINIAPFSFPPDLSDRATSLESEAARGIDPADVLVETLAALAWRYDDLMSGRFDAILDAWRALAPSAAGATVTWRSTAGILSGVTAGIDDHGALLVRVAGRIERIVAGDLSWW
jgi:BirA family transcriptional regulator, biotin operon repressor / biotin---[acetyl-CoA-carboxylase] ligase